MAWFAHGMVVSIRYGTHSVKSRRAYSLIINCAQFCEVIWGLPSKVDKLTRFTPTFVYHKWDAYLHSCFLILYRKGIAPNPDWLEDACLESAIGMFQATHMLLPVRRCKLSN